MARHYSQAPPKDLSKNQSHQSHHLKSFISGQFSGPKLGWSTSEKEAFAVIAKVQEMHLNLAPLGRFDMFTDHLDLIFWFILWASCWTCFRPRYKNIVCGAVRVACYSYTCVHIQGFENVSRLRWLTRRLLCSVPCSSVGSGSGLTVIILCLFHLDGIT